MPRYGSILSELEERLNEHGIVADAREVAIVILEIARAQVPAPGHPEPLPEWIIALAMEVLR